MFLRFFRAEHSFEETFSILSTTELELMGMTCFENYSLILDVKNHLEQLLNILMQERKKSKKKYLNNS